MENNSLYMQKGEQFGQANDHLSRELSTNEILPFSHASCSHINWSKEIYIEPQLPNLLVLFPVVYLLELRSF